MYTTKQERDVLAMRQEDKNYVFEVINIKIPIWKMFARMEFLESECTRLFGREFDIVESLMYHYQHHDRLYWRDFLESWVHTVTNFAFVCCNDVVCAMVFYYMRDDGIYIRLLCSKLKCGSLALQYVANTYPNINITLNSEPSAIKFYVRHGFEVSKDAPLEDGRNPLMILKRETKVHMNKHVFVCGTVVAGLAYMFWHLKKI